MATKRTGSKTTKIKQGTTKAQLAAGLKMPAGYAASTPTATPTTSDLSSGVNNAGMTPTNTQTAPKVKRYTQPTAQTAQTTQTAQQTSYGTGTPGTPMYDASSGEAVGGYDSTGAGFRFGNYTDNKKLSTAQQTQQTQSQTSVMPSRYTKPAEPKYDVLSAPTLGAVNEKQIRNDVRRRMQGSIDAINANYASLVSQERVQGEDRSGQTRALNARSGTLGSDFGSAAMEKTVSYNRQQEQYLRDQQNMQIQQVMNNIEDRASSEIQMRKQDARDKYSIDIENFKAAKEQARVDLKTLAESGADLSTLNPNQKTALFRQAGYDPGMGELVYNAMKPKPKQIDYKFEKLADGTGLFYGTDPATGELRTQKVSVDLPPDWQMQIAPDGTIIGYDKNTGAAKILSDQGQFSGETALEQAYKQAQIAKIYGDLNKDGVTIDDQGNIVYTDPAKKPLDSYQLSQQSRQINSLTDIFRSGSLDSVVGPNSLTRQSNSNWFAPLNWARELANPEGAKVVGDVEKMLSQLTTKTFQEAKAGGVTFGAASEAEWQLLAKSASALGQYRVMKGDKVIGYDVTQPKFKEELQDLTDQMKASFINNGGNPEEVGVKQGADGSYLGVDWQGRPYRLDGINFKSVGNTSASTNQVKAYRQTASKAEPIAFQKALVQLYPEGSKPVETGAASNQCGYYARNVVKKMGFTYPTLGDGLNEKKAAVAKHGSPLETARTGSVIVTAENPTYGHVAVITGKTKNGFIVTESNFKRSERISHGRVIPYNSPKIIGIINPTKA